MKAIITAGGIGTRLLPITTIIPKTLLPVINKPFIHYIVKQFYDAGIREIIIVSNYTNDLIQEYFSQNINLNINNELLDELQTFIQDIEFTFVKQDKQLPYGNAAPLYTIKNLLNEPFIYSWGDVLIWGDNTGTKEILDLFKAYPESKGILTTQEVSEDLIPKKGIIRIKKDTTNEIDLIIEKPTIEEAPTNINSTAPYLFTPEIFDYLDPQKLHKNSGEFTIQTAIQEMIDDGHLILANMTKGKYLTNGDIHSYMDAIETIIE